MRTIKKGLEPQSLREHRTSGGTYADFPHTDDLRHALLEEQGHLCCFCMRSIALRGMKIAHWASQSEHKDKSARWDNLLGACMGGDGQRGAEQHCDTAQGKTPIKVHPADRKQSCERLIRYLSDGRIESSDPDIHKDLDQTLNLNCRWLKAARKGIYDTAISRLTKTESGYWSREDLQAEIEKWKQRQAGKHRELCQVAIYTLEKKLQKRND